MTKLMDEAIDALHDLPEDRQEMVARAILDYAAHVEGEVYRLSDDERTRVRVGLEQAERGEFLTRTELEEFRDRPRS
jgi:hypothetical protein